MEDGLSTRLVCSKRSIFLDFWFVRPVISRPLMAEIGRLGLPPRSARYLHEALRLNRPNPAVRRNPLAIDTLSANRVVSQRA